jgi:hypothetical protein
MRNYGPALDAALNKEIGEQDRRNTARLTFHTVLLNGSRVYQALDAALNTVADDGDQYMSMHDTFWEVQNKREQTLLGRIAGIFESGKAQLRLNGPTVLH